ncbi:MAG: peptidyl-prolyl cis-trans isomerase, partial [Thermoanaerobaculia bacterium]|nr:peptidyl-prolyl cis-trans isomerase [Thermoanaerobaculia bacterium]
KGGSLGWQSRRQIGSWGPTIKNALDGLQPGQRTGLLRDESGLWIFELRARREAKPAPFETVREKIRGELRALEIRDLEGAVRQEQIEALGIVIRDESMSPEPSANRSQQGSEAPSTPAPHGF